MVDLPVFGSTRPAQLGDLSVGVTAPLGLGADEFGSLVQRALIRMASDFGFAADSGVGADLIDQTASAGFRIVSSAVDQARDRDDRR